MGGGKGQRTKIIHRREENESDKHMWGKETTALV